MPDSLPHAEDASLYVLDLLDAEARRSFEAELEASPELQRHVADLQANLDALALSTPAVLPPPSVWTGIAQRIAAEPAPAPAAVSAPPATLWSYLQHLLTNGWAVAAALALAFTCQVFWNVLPGPSRPVAEAGDSFPENPGSATRRTGDSRSTDPATLVASAAGHGTAESPGSRPGRASAESATAADDAARLQDRVRLLSEQVAMLTHMLAQRAVLPAGSAQLQVFRLVASNGLPDASETSIPDPRRTGLSSSAPLLADAGTAGTPGTPSGAGTGTATGSNTATGTGSGTVSTTLASASQELPFALALAAARQFAGVTAPTEGAGVSQITDPTTIINRNAQTPTSNISLPTSDGTASVTDNGTPGASGSTIQVLDLSTGSGNGGVSIPVASTQDPAVVSGSDATAFGAYSPETGLGAIAFRAQNGTTDTEVYQLWMTDPHTGIVQSVGFTGVANTSQASQVVVLRFAADANTLTQPSFMITREPAGGSIVPTGPIVAQPPTSAVFPPTP